MPRRIEHTATYAHSPAAVHAALTDEAYWTARLAEIGGSGATLDYYRSTDGGAEVVLTQVIAAANLPAIVGRISPGDLSITRTEAWSALDDSAATATVTALIAGTPARVTGTSTLGGAAERTTVRVRGEAQVSVPLIGGSIEQAVADNVVRLLEAEARFTEQWIAGR